MSFSIALTTGSGIGIRTEATSCGDGAPKLLKFGNAKPFGKEKPSNFGQARRLKLGSEKRLKFGRALAVAAPMTARAAKDTTIAGTRLEATGCAVSGGLSPCVALSGVSATCVPRVSAQSQDFPSPPISKTKKSRRVDDRATTLAGLPTHIRLKSWAYMVKDRLFPVVSPVRRSTAGRRRCVYR